MQSLYKAAHTASLATVAPKHRSDLDISKLATELVRVPLLSDLDTVALRKLAQEAAAEVHLPGSVLMRQGDHGDRMLLLTQGAVRVLKIPDEEFVVVHSSGRWRAHVPPTLKPVAQVRPTATWQRRPLDLMYVAWGLSWKCIPDNGASVTALEIDMVPLACTLGKRSSEPASGGPSLCFKSAPARLRCGTMWPQGSWACGRDSQKLCWQLAYGGMLRSMLDCRSDLDRSVL